MKFGCNLQRHWIPEWNDFYFNYNCGKRLFKSACEASTASPEIKYAIFSELDDELRHELYKVETFYSRRFLTITKHVDLFRDYWGLPLDIPLSVNLAYIYPEELEQLLASYLEVQDWLICLLDFGYINRESFCRIFSKREKSPSNLVAHFTESHLLNSQFAHQKPVLSLLEQCKSMSSRLKHAISNNDPNSAQFSLFLQYFSARSFMRLNIAHLAIKADDASGLEDFLKEKDRKDEIDSQSLSFALLECSMRLGSMKCFEMLLSRVLLYDKSTEKASNSLFTLVSSVGRMRRDPDGHDRVALGFLVGQLLSSNWRIMEVKDTFQRSPLHYAAFYGLSEICEDIVACIGKAVKFTNSTILDTILQPDADGHTPLGLGIIRGNTNVTRVFLKACQEITDSTKRLDKHNLRNVLGSLLCVALRSNFDEIVNILIAHDATLNFPHVLEESALYIASQKGLTKIVEAILDLPLTQEIDVDLVESTQGWTPLFIASIEGHVSIVQCLLEAKANPRLCDHVGWTPMEHAAFRGHMEVVDLLNEFISHGFSASSVERRTIVPGTSLIYSRERQQKTPSVCRSQHLMEDNDCQILITLGPSNTRSELKAVKLEDSLASHPLLASHREVGYALEVSAIGAAGATKLVYLPMLHDMINEPWVFTTKDLAKVKLHFRLYRVESYETEAKLVVGNGIALLKSLDHGFVLKRESLDRDYTIPILDERTSDFIGSVTFSFLVVAPLQFSIFPSASRHGFWKTDGFTQVVGHRGFGANSIAHTNLQIGENTVQSFMTAVALGASCVEFDVQLTKDYVPIIFHDFLVMETGGDIPLYMLSFDQFMHISRSQAPRGYLSGMAEARYLEKTQNQEAIRRKPRSHSLNSYDDYRSQDLVERMKYTEEGMQNNIKGNLRGHSIQEPSTSLEQLLTNLPSHIAFNIEIKYPMLWEAEDRQMETYGIELNLFVDTILKTIYRFGTNRNITLSSFSPEICILLSLKQKEYPILFINKAGSVPTGDTRASSLQSAIQFAKSWHLSGIVMLSDPFVWCPRLIQYAKGSGLICGSYGNLNDNPQYAMIQAEAGLDAIMVNKVRLIAETFAKARARAPTGRTGNQRG